MGPGGGPVVRRQLGGQLQDEADLSPSARPQQGGSHRRSHLAKCPNVCKFQCQESLLLSPVMCCNKVSRIQVFFGRECLGNSKMILISLPAAMPFSTLLIPHKVYLRKKRWERLTWENISAQLVLIALNINLSDWRGDLGIRAFPCHHCKPDPSGGSKTTRAFWLLLR